MKTTTEEAAMGRDVQVSTTVTTSATTREATVTAQPNVVYHTHGLGGARYSVTPHPPEKRDR